MSWGTPVELANDNNKAGNAASVVLTTGADAAAGDVVFVCLAKDNLTNVDGDVRDDVHSVIDSVGNIYTPVRCQQNAGAAQATTIAALYFCQIPVALASGQTITINFQGTTANNDALGYGAFKSTPTAGHLIQCVGHAGLNTDGADPGDITLGSLASAEYLWVYVLAAEGPATDGYSMVSSYNAITSGGTTGSTDATNQHFLAYYRIFTGTTDTVQITSNTADRDYAQILAAFRTVSVFSAGTSPAQLVNSGGLVG